MATQAAAAPAPAAVLAPAAPEAAQPPVAAQVVGNAFVQQYYQILHHSPEHVHKFYQEISKLGRPEDDGSMSLTTTMKGINEKILSFNYGDYRAEIRSVDSQESFNGGVQVLVTGYLTGKDNKIQNFSQSFFLAPQDRGYFVLNDIFRVIEIGNQLDGNLVPVIDVVDPVVPEQNSIPPVQEELVSQEGTSLEEVVEDEVYNPPENGDIPVVKEEVPVAEEELPVAEVVDEVKDDSRMVIESDINVETAPKKSYASIVMDLKGRGVTFSPPAPAMRKYIPKSQEQAKPPPAPEAVGQVPNSDAVDSGNNQDIEADGYSIYIKGLPMNATILQLENEFKKFGPIRNGGIQVRSNRQQGFCFGFVEFEAPNAVEKALEASPITIGGRQAVVEEKRSTNSRGSIRGRFQSGRGSGFRNEGVRGRGNYGGGRGYNNRGDFNNNRNEFGEFNNRSEFNTRGGPNRGGSSNRSGDGYQRSDSNNGRTNRGAGRIANGTRPMEPRVAASG